MPRPPTTVVPQDALCAFFKVSGRNLAGARGHRHAIPERCFRLINPSLNWTLSLQIEKYATALSIPD